MAVTVSNSKVNRTDFYSSSARTFQQRSLPSHLIWFAIPFLLETSTLFSLPTSRCTIVLYFLFHQTPLVSLPLISQLSSSRPLAA